VVVESGGRGSRLGEKCAEDRVAGVSNPCGRRTVRSKGRDCAVIETGEVACRDAGLLVGDSDALLVQRCRTCANAGHAQGFASRCLPGLPCGADHGTTCSRAAMRTWC